MDKEQTKLLREILASLGRIEALLRAGAEAEGYDIDHCPSCGSSDLQDASVMGLERFVCRGCGAGMTKEAVRG